MTDIQELLSRLFERQPEWQPAGSQRGLVVKNGGRKQRIRVTSRKGDALLWSIVTSGPFSNHQRRDNAKLAWERNAQAEIVSFRIDQRDRLIGEIRHPLSTLDDDEMEFLVQTLAEQCDLFEAVLESADWE